MSSPRSQQAAKAHARTNRRFLAERTAGTSLLVYVQAANTLEWIASYNASVDAHNVRGEWGAISDRHGATQSLLQRCPGFGAGHGARSVICRCL